MTIDFFHELRYLRYGLVNMSGVPYDSNQELPLYTRPVEIYWLHDNAAQDKPQPHEASLMGPWPAALFAFPRFWGEPNKAWQEREAIFPASTTTTGHACGLLRGLQKHELLLTSTYNRSQIIGSMIHVRCSRYLVTHQGSFEYQFHKDGLNMLFSPFSLNGRFSRSMVR